MKTQRGGQTTVVVPHDRRGQAGQPPREARVGVNDLQAPPLPTPSSAELAIPVGESALSTIRAARPSRSSRRVRASARTPEPRRGAGASFTAKLAVGVYDYDARCPGDADDRAGRSRKIVRDWVSSGLPVATIDERSTARTARSDPRRRQHRHRSEGRSAARSCSSTTATASRATCRPAMRKVLALRRLRAPRHVLHAPRRHRRCRDGHAELNILAGESAIVHDLPVRSSSRSTRDVRRSRSTATSSPMPCRSRSATISATRRRAIPPSGHDRRDQGRRHVAGKPLSRSTSRRRQRVDPSTSPAAPSRRAHRSPLRPGVDFRFVRCAGAQRQRQRAAVRVDYDKQVHCFMRCAGTGDQHVAPRPSIPA